MNLDITCYKKPVGATRRGLFNSPTSFFVLLVSAVSAVSGSQAFDLIYVMTAGGPADSTALVVFYIYQQAFKFNNYGYAAAMASVLVVVLLAMTVVLFGLTRGGRFHLQ